MLHDNKVTIRALSVWLVCALFFMYEFLLRTVLGTFQAPIMLDLELSPVRFALLSSTSYQLAYSCMQIPVGIITGRFGLKRTLLAAVIFCTIANLGFAFTHAFASAAIFRILMGIGSAFGFVCLLIAVYDWLPRKYAAFFIGLSQFIGTLGPMIAAGPLNMLSEAHIVDWRTLFISLAAAGAVIAALIFGIVDNNRHNQGKFIILNRATSIRDSLMRLIREPQVWYIGLFSSSIYFSIEYFSENEGVLFLQAKGFSAGYASYMISLAWLGYAISCPLIGFISDKIQKRKPMMIFCALCALSALSGIIFLPSYPSLTTLSFILLGVGTSGQSLGFAIMAEQCKENYLAVGLAFNNSMIMIFAAVSAPLIGFMLAQIEAQHPLQLADLQHTFTVLLPMTAVSLFIAMVLISETFCKMVRTNTRLNPAWQENG
ncbi:MAG: MFS transporter [Legionellaceae bacterium]|nr:MFS transporter [Legionellaceae bacterium]